MTLFEIKSRIVANNILPIFWFGFIIIGMDKLKKVLKHLFAPAIVLLLVAILGVFSPVASVAAAIRLNVAATPGVDATVDCTISNLPSRTVKVDTEITTPTISSGTVKLCHSNKVQDSFSSTYTYSEVGQYEWRFYTAGGQLFDTYTVTVTDTTYRMTMPSDVVTVAPKNLAELKLPLPSTYTVGGETMKVGTITPSDNAHNYAVIELKDKKDNSTNYHLSVEVALENDTFTANTIGIDDKNVTINLTNKGTGNLKVTYLLSDASDKLLVAVPLSNIEVKNVNVDDVTFANIPTAPSVSNLSYYSSVSLTAPTADSAKVGKDTFAVEAQTSIVKVQAYLFSTQPNNWTNTANVRTFTVDANGVVKEGNNVVTDVIEIDGLNVKVKALGWYRFQFETKTLFGYQMDKDFDNYDAIEQDKNESHKSYVRYWSDSVSIYEDKAEPNFAWVKEHYNKDDNTKIDELNENFSDLLDDCDKYLPMTEKPDESTSKKITVNFDQGLTLPAIFPHDNATSFADLKITTFSIDQIQDADGNSVSDNYVWKGDNSSEHYFKYDMTKHLHIGFEATPGVQSEDNNITLKQSEGLYRIRIVVEEVEPKFTGNNEKYEHGYAKTRTKYLYFYVKNNTNFQCGAVGNDDNSPVIDENKAFQVSDVYLWESRTFDFPAPNFSDNNTPNDNLQIDYYLVRYLGSQYETIAKLDYTTSASRVTVDLDKLQQENGNPVNNIDGYFDPSAKFYIYAVARNFNGMQADLNNYYTPVGSVNGTYFTSELFNAGVDYDKNEIAQYGYAWKRAEFRIHQESTTAPTDIDATSIEAEDSKFITGNYIKIGSAKTTWSSNTDGQMSVAAYLVKGDKLVPVDVFNGKDAGAEVVTSIASNRSVYELKNLYFTPGVSGQYIFVVSAKANDSKNVATEITTINVDVNEELGARIRTSSIAPMGTDSGSNLVAKQTITMGNSITLPDYDLTDSNNNPVYLSKNRNLYAPADLTTPVGYYTITVKGVNDPNCITGNKFTPNNFGKYVFEYNFYKNDGSKLVSKPQNYVVQVNNSSSTASILMGEDYDAATANHIIELTGGLADSAVSTNDEVEIKVNGATELQYHIGAYGTGSENKPAYAITLPQFTKANYGSAKDFVIDSAWIYDYLEPIYGTTTDQIKGYMYPAIAIPMPNVISDNISSEDVEITVQKSGSSNYKVSSKKLNAGGSSNKASVIADKFGGYFVFRPEGTFSNECKDVNHNGNNYLPTANSLTSASGVYTVTYKTSSTTVSYNITLGNLKNGEISWNEGFLTYNNGKGDQNITEATEDLIIEKDSNGHRYVTIDMTKVFFAGNEDMLDLIKKGPNGDPNVTTGFNSANSDAATEYYWDKVRVTVSYEDGSFIDYGDWSDQDSEVQKIKNHGEYKYKFDLSQGSGTYKVNISMTNSYTASTVTKSIEFTIDAEATNKNVNLNTVWGVILIVLSVGLLGGVIFYFVKTARATRFVDAPRAVKGNDKTKATKSVTAPKDVEAPKKDAK